MNELEDQLLRQEIGNTEPKLRIRTRTRIDAGRWWRRTPVWLCIVGDELILLAVARRRYFERIPLADCRESHYAPATGELVIAPTESLRIQRLALSPRNSLEVIDFLKKR